MPDLPIDPAAFPGTPEYQEMLEERKERQERRLYDLWEESQWSEGHLYRAHS